MAMSLMVMLIREYWDEVQARPAQRKRRGSGDIHSLLRVKGAQVRVCERVQSRCVSFEFVQTAVHSVQSTELRWHADSRERRETSNVR